MMQQQFCSWIFLTVKSEDLKRLMEGRNASWDLRHVKTVPSLGGPEHGIFRGNNLQVFMLRKYFFLFIKNMIL